MEILDLGCGKRKLKGAFGVDYFPFEGVDLKYDLEKALPKEHYQKYDLVYSNCIIEHLGNPLLFLENCKKYAKPEGIVQVITDNGDYWRYHKLGWPFGNYHSTLWENDSKDDQVQHKMMFQLKHLERMFRLAGLKVSESGYFQRYNVDYIFPKHQSYQYINVKGKV